jgi:hypothetical protein
VLVHHVALRAVMSLPAGSRRGEREVPHVAGVADRVDDDAEKAPRAVKGWIVSRAIKVLGFVVLVLTPAHLAIRARSRSAATPGRRSLPVDLDLELRQPPRENGTTPFAVGGKGGTGLGSKNPLGDCRELQLGQEVPGGGSGLAGGMEAVPPVSEVPARPHCRPGPSR